MDPPTNAAWDNDDCESDLGDAANKYISSIDHQIDYDEPYEAVLCIELSTASKKFARFEFVYWFLSFAEQFGFYWITFYGIERFGWNKWLNQYIICFAIACFISIFSSPIIGRLSDRYGRKAIILLTILLESVPFIPMALYPDDVTYFLYALPLIGICGSISPINGVMKAFVVDCLPKKFLISGFAELTAVYASAGIVSSVVIYTVIGNDIRKQFYEDELFNFSTQLIMLIVIGIFVVTCLFFAIIVPESLVLDEYKLKFISLNPCHGISHAISNSVLSYSALFIFFVGFAQIGIGSIVEDIFLIDFDDSNYENVDLFIASRDKDIMPTDIPTELSDDVTVYAAFLFMAGFTLCAAPCCIKCCCANAVTSMIWAVILMIVSFCLMVFLLISDEWYAFIASLVCGTLFAMGQIGMVYLDGLIAKYMNSKQYGMSYGLLHSVYSLTKASAPYCFFLLFELFSSQDSTPNEMFLDNAKPVIYVAILLAIIGALIALFAIRRSIKKYQDLNKDSKQIKKAVKSPHNYSTNDERFQEGDVAMKDQYEPQNMHIQNRQHRAPSAPKLPEEEEVEMQPPPPQQPGYYQQYSPQIMQPQQYMQPVHYAPSSSYNDQPAYVQYPQQQPVYSGSAQYSANQSVIIHPQYGAPVMSDRV